MVNYDLGYLDQSLQFSQQHAPGPMLPFPQSYATTSYVPQFSLEMVF